MSAVPVEAPVDLSYDAVYERIRRRVVATLRDYLDFYQEIKQDTEDGWPTWPQSIRIRAAMKEGARVLNADQTGVNGKTLVGVGTKLLLDKTTGRKHTAFCVVPNGGLRGAFAPERIDDYAAKLHVFERDGNGDVLIEDGKPIVLRQRVVPVYGRRDLQNICEDTDFVLLNWEKLRVAPDSSAWRQIEEAVRFLNPDLFLFDESHHGKGIGSLQGRSVQRLNAMTLDSRVLLSSADPIPNKYRDLSMLLHLLDPQRFSDPSVFSAHTPDMMRELLHSQQWFRLTRKQMKEPLGLGELVEKTVEVSLSDAEADVYFKAWADCVQLGAGLTELRKILYDARLSKYADQTGEFGEYSSKFMAAKRACDWLVADGHKVIIKTSYVTDIVDRLAECVGHDALVVYGQTDASDRPELYNLWKSSSKHHVIIVSDVASESIDLTCGDTPVDIISLEPEMTPRECNQIQGRAYRRGQRGDVTHYSLVSVSDKLKGMMLGYLEELKREYNVRIPKRFVPRCIDVDLLAMQRAKREIAEKIYSCKSLTPREERLHDAGSMNARTYLEALISPACFGTSTKERMPPFAQATLAQARWRNLGEDGFKQLVRGRGWRKWTELYEAGWDGSASQATLKIIGSVVDTLYDGEDPVIVDIGSGAAYFTRATGKPAYLVDIDKKFLDKGRREMPASLADQCRFVHASATATGLAARLADVCINSYSLFYLGQDDRRSQVEDAIIETNRIVKPGGHFILSLPYTIEPHVAERFMDHMPSYGFVPAAYLDPRSTRSENMRRGCHVMVFNRTTRKRKKRGLDLSFYEERVRFVC